MTSRPFHPLSSAPLLMPAIAFMAGIAAGQHAESSVCWLLFSVSLVAILLLYRWPQTQSLAILFCVAALGSVRSAMVRSEHDGIRWPQGTVAFEAVIVSEVAEKPKTVAADMIIADIGRKIKGYIAKDDKSRHLKVGDRLKICALIDRNREWHHGTFDYHRYLEVHGFSGQTFVRSGNWQLQNQSWQGLTAWQRLRLHFLCYRHRLLERYRQMGFSDDAYAVVAAMTLGDKSAMTSGLREVYAVSGASHVLALSGLHLGIIYMVLTLLVVGRRWRYATQLLAIAGIWAFALLVGLPASVLRAAIMITAFALLSLPGRGRSSLNALALAAFIILTVSPDSLYDVGFQLSFAAMLGILLIQPLLERLLRREWLMEHRVAHWAWGLATVSVAAQMGTAPLVAYYFGRFSTWFLLTNLVVIPATTAILYLAIVTLLLPQLGSVLLHVVGWLNAVLTLMATRLPLASIEGLHPSALQTAMVYVIILCIYLIILRYDKSV